MDAEAQPERAPSANGLKRRHSELSEQDSKRPRISPGKNSPASKPVNDDRRKEEEERGQNGSPHARSPAGDKGSDAGAARKKSKVMDEKQRSRRLFGGLLGSLAQTGDSRTSKRRQEIETRRKAELQRQDDERLEDKQKRLERLKEKRQSVKRKLEEEQTRRRHDEMLSKARFLRTETEPRLYYKPWDLRPEEEDRIDEQVREAKTRIDDEVADIETIRSKEREANGDHDGIPSSITATNGGASNDTPGDLTMAEDSKEIPTAPDGDNSEQQQQAPADGVGEKESNGTLPTTSNGESPSRTPEAGEQKAPSPAAVEGEATEHDDEHIVEGEEDTVIY